MFWKFYGLLHDVGGTPRIIKKMTDMWKTVLGSTQCQKCVDGGSWISLALLTRLRNYKFYYFGSFTEFDVMSEECPQLSRKLTNFWKIVLGSRQCWSSADKGSWVSLASLTRLRSYRLCYFRSFTELVAMSEKRLELSAKWQTFRDLFFSQ